MAAELVYVAALAGIGLMIAMAVSLFRCSPGGHRDPSPARG
jgi:hypothetical protein